jgi:Rrf2 family protein
MTQAEQTASSRRSQSSTPPLHVTAEIEYAVRALVALATDGPMTAANIAARRGLSRPFLQQVLGRLRNAELVTSRRGPKGGYELRRAAELIRIADIMTSLDNHVGDIRPPLPCWDQVDELWRALGDTVHSALSRTSIADLAREVSEPGSI